MCDDIKYVDDKIPLVEKYASFIMPVVLILADYIAVVAAEGIAYWLRKSVIAINFFEFKIPDFYFYLIIPAIFLAFLHFGDTYIRRTPFWQLAEGIFKATVYAMVTVVLLMYFGGVAGMISRIFVGCLWLLIFMFIVSSRYFVKRVLNSLGILQIPVIFIGAGKTAELVLQSFENDSGFGYKVKGIIDDNPISKNLAARFRLLGGFGDAEQIIKNSEVQHVFITAPGLERDKLLDLINKVQPHVKNVAFVPDLIGLPVGSIEVETLFDEKIMMLRMRNNLARCYNRITKKIFDMVVSLLGLIVIVPVGIIISICIYITSPGPVIFAHRRVGRHGREFPCYKFRTMVMNSKDVLEKHLSENPEALEEWVRDFKLKDDPRVTRIGEFLRKTSLDELPQLLNVLKGEMSLVGPRPIVQEEVERYGDYINDYYLVSPGITGMWQISGRNDVSYDNRVQMDSWYVRNWSIWIDIVYLLKTVKVVLDRKGAY